MAARRGKFPTEMTYLPNRHLQHCSSVLAIVAAEYRHVGQK